jgi:hypothetical protein
MPISMYQASVPIFVQLLGGLTNIFDKAEAHCAAHKLDESVLLQMRIFPDMFHMALQAKTTLFHSGGAAARLAGLDVLDYFDAGESSFAVLKKQTGDALELIQGIKPEQIDGSENRQIEVKLRTYALNFTGQDFLFHFTIPQLFFHAATAYDILRGAGLELGKRDFMGEMPN